MADKLRHDRMVELVELGDSYRLTADGLRQEET
jgi:hypothetical protein